MFFLNVKKLYNGQYVFRRQQTIIAILELVAGLTTLMIFNSSFTYLKNKAFNTVDNSILLQKLENHGIIIIA